MDQEKLIPHLFRMEFSKICSVLSGYFGLDHVELAEDITSETFLAALETWPYNGMPENPTAWLYTVAKNKTKNYLNRNKLFSEKIRPELLREDTSFPEPDLSEENITDSQLNMLFAICEPSIPAESQIGLALRVLCGLGIDEIATAFLESKETINKRLFRARQKLRTQSFDQILRYGAVKNDERLVSVLTTVYLLFNEGYYSETNNELLREELCREAMHLMEILLSRPDTSKPEVHALYALMCFHASRFRARKGEHGEVILYDDQDENLWDMELISKGAFHLNQSSKGDHLSHYHLEAAIAYWHTKKTGDKEKWTTILRLYDELVQIRYTPIADLNRIYALSRVMGKQIALKEAENLQLTNQPYYYRLLAELYSDIDNNRALDCLEKAWVLARTNTEKQQIQEKLESWSK
jgi:RNA polymerase sigma factor (sigma-70 family)